MPSKYAIRSEAGTLKAKVDARIMAILTRENGEWRPYEAAEQGSKVCFEFYVDMKFDLNSFGIGLELFIWKGDKLIPC